MEQRGKLPSIELLRGLAAASVMFHHFSGFGTPILYAVFFAGHIGVDAFFIVSGFVIYISTDKDRDAIGFLIRRAFRINAPALASHRSGC